MTTGHRFLCGTDDNRSPFPILHISNIAEAKVLRIHTNGQLVSKAITAQYQRDIGETYHATQATFYMACFRAHHSREAALNHLVYLSGANIGKGPVNGVLMLDLRNALDIVKLTLSLGKLAIPAMRWMDLFIRIKTLTYC